MFFTTSEKLKTTKEYQSVVAVVSKLDQSGVMWLGRGHCISMAEIIRTALTEVGIKTRILECQMLLMNNTTDPPFISTVGYDGICNPGEIDTHVVCITDTPVPMLIDASIGHRLPDDVRIVVEELSQSQNGIFCESERNGIKLIYQQKSNPKVALQFQQSILERMDTDKKVFHNIGFLKMLVALALTVSTMNATRGFYDFYQKYYSEEAKIGVSAFEDIDERFDKVEDILEKIQNKLKNLN